MPKPLQPSLPIKVEVKTPLVSMDFVRSVDGADQDEVLCRLQDGRIAWAWDLGCDRSNRQFVRIWRECLNPNSKAQEASFDQVMRAIYGEPRKYVEGVSLAGAIWICSTELVVDLCREGSLEVLPGTTWGRGPYGTPLITWASLMHFMKERRIN